MRTDFLTPEAIGETHGIKVYRTNPSVPAAGSVTRTRRRQIGDAHRGFIVDGDSREVLGAGVAIAYEWEEVDAERFVKLFLAGFKKAAGLSKSGTIVFGLVYNAMRQNPGNDTITLSVTESGLKKTTYYDGLRELLEREFLFRSPFGGVFFVNIQYMFNGDRLAFVKAYHLKGKKPNHQLEFLPESHRKLP